MCKDVFAPDVTHQEYGIVAVMGKWESLRRRRSEKHYSFDIFALSAISMAKEHFHDCLSVSIFPLHKRQYKYCTILILLLSLQKEKF